VGDAETTPGGTVPAPTENCNPIDYSKYTLPNPTCTHEGVIIRNSSGDFTAYPGLYGSNFSFNSIDDTPGGGSGGTIHLQKGIYCLYNGIDLHSTWIITSDMNNNGQYDVASEGVLFFVPQGVIRFNGNSHIDVHAVGSTLDDFPKEFVNYLIYVPPTNPDQVVDITGSNGSQFTGTIFAPAAEVTLNGGSGTVGLDSQVIGYAVKIDGSGTLDIHYNATQNATTTTNPSLAQTGN
jgi:hypothetical protein